MSREHGFPPSTAQYISAARWGVEYRHQYHQPVQQQQQPPQPGQHGTLTIGLLIDEECIARVIGKQGAGLKHIRQASGCQLQVAASAGDNGSAPRRVTIIGTVPGLGAATSQTLAKAFGDTATHTAVTVFIPLEYAGTVAGKAGSNLKRLRDMFNVRTELEREVVSDPVHGAERRVTMMGPWTSMAQALVMALGGWSQLSYDSGFSYHGVPTPMNGGALMSDVRKLSEDPEEIQLHMVVPDRLVGALLGKEGCEIKMLAATTGCKVCVSKKDFGERHVITIGKFIPCLTALKALQDALVAAAGQLGVDVSSTTIIFFIKSSSIGYIVGKGGDNLRELRQMTGTKVKVEREEINSQRACIISGSREQVMQAVNMVHAFLSTGLESEAYDIASESAMTAKRTLMEGGTTKLLVPATNAGLIIGRQGAGLAQIRQSCNVHLDVLQAQQTPQFFGDRVISLQGSLQSRFLAAMTVLQTAFHVDLAFVQLKMLVPDSKAGTVVGRQGSNLKLIREQSGVHVKLDKQGIMGERLVSAQGSLESIRAVVQWIMQILEGSADSSAP